MLKELLDEMGYESTEDIGRPGKFEGETAMTLMLYSCYRNGDHGDDEVSFGDCDGANRYGRRILWFSSTGFVSSGRYATEEEAQKVMEELHETYDTDEEG